MVDRALITMDDLSSHGQLPSSSFAIQSWLMLSMTNLLFHHFDFYLKRDSALLYYLIFNVIVVRRKEESHGVVFVVSVYSLSLVPE